ncbi:hypothetical protein RJT34_23581 [Clitoria ternatea]|uniref:Uncharacterized protein n=1 Tax=Clitoria ternatea TaxID=43366 RepID=A0AAN9FPA9_CLITE
MQQLQRRDSNHSSLGGLVNAITTKEVFGHSTTNALPAKMYEEQMKHSNPMDTQTSQPLLDARMALLKLTNHPGISKVMSHGYNTNILAYGSLYMGREEYNQSLELQMQV